MDFDYCIVGGGIIGMATARELTVRNPGARILVIEKEPRPAIHQTGHNSGVIHAGVYYQPGSLKARLCKKGAEATKKFCCDHHIPFENCGKLLVATSPAELERMAELKIRARQNGIHIEQISAAKLRSLEPNIAGSGALLVPETGIVDYRLICTAMSQQLQDNGVRFMTGTQLASIREDDNAVRVAVSTGERFRVGKLVACAGLQSDRVAKMAGLEVNYRIIPFRGEYYTLPTESSSIVKHLIYPIPDPQLPFLGIHLTRTIDGRVTVGPNAVLGFAREGYEKGSFDASDVLEMVSFAGFWRMASKHIRSGLAEFRNSLSRQRYLKECQKYCPSLTLDQFHSPGAGIRAQAVLDNGTLVHDFLFADTERQLHVCNAPSPAATSAIPIAEMIVDRFEGRTA